jgi:hypothetical protein
VDLRCAERPQGEPACNQRCVQTSTAQAPKAPSLTRGMKADVSLVRACAWCEKELGPVAVKPGQSKTHGVCRRHFEQHLRDAGIAEAEIQASLAKREINWCPDLKLVQARALKLAAAAAQMAVAIAEGGFNQQEMNTHERDTRSDGVMV